jgi:SPX domain protein involved in polyphosphate accumulation
MVYFLLIQIEKIVLFLLEQQGMLASRIEKLGKQRAILAEQPDISGIADLREAYREVGLDLIKLLKFVDLNATGIRKILKKFDKRFSYRFTDYYVSSRSNHPYSQLQQVFKHVVMYCLQNLIVIQFICYTPYFHFVYGICF